MNTATANPGDAARANRLACTDLLCRLDSNVVRLKQLQEKAAYSQVLELSKSSLVDVVNFAEEHLNRNDLDAVIDAVSSLYSQIKDIDAQLNEMSWRMFKGRKTSLGKKIPEFEALFVNYLAFMARVFDHCANVLLGPAGEDDRTMFRESAKVLLTEFSSVFLAMVKG